MSDNPMQPVTTPTLSRLDYIATAIYAAWNAAHPEQFIKSSVAVELAKDLIAELDKEQTP